MAYKAADQILQPDNRFDNLCVVEPGGVRFMNLADHHQMIGDVPLTGSAPDEVRDAYDRARNTMLYAFFDYDLLVVGEIQAFGAFELALKHRINGHGLDAKGSLRTLVDRARKQGIFPKIADPSQPFADRIEAMIALRNGLGGEAPWSQEPDIRGANPKPAGAREFCSRPRLQRTAFVRDAPEAVIGIASETRHWIFAGLFNRTSKAAVH